MKIKTKDFIAAYNAHFKGNVLKFHKYLVKHHGLTEGGHSGTYKRIKLLKARGDLELEAGVSVETGTVLTGISRYHKLDDGGVWVKSDVEKAKQLEAFKEAVDEITMGIPSVLPVPKPVDILDEDLTVFYPLPDLHFGLLIHAEESNHPYNWDMKIATKWVMSAMDHLVETAPKAKYAVITDLGDLLHAEDNMARTSSGHQLDTDGRHSKIVKASFEIVRRLIDNALIKHDTVYFYSVAGNHSENSSIYLKAFLSAWYRNEPRVIIYEPHVAQQYHIFGKNILGFSHGHELKPQRASEVLIADNHEAFSNSEYRYFHFGHFHSGHTVEGPLCITEVHKNIIPRDKWADSMGFRGHIGQAKSIFYHKDFGEIGRSIFNIKMTKE